MCLIAETGWQFADLLATVWTIALAVIGIGLVIFVHELGHFLAAKACGVKCEKFYIGFDAFEIRLGPLVIPRALWKFQWGETEYGIGILPLGGYVKMLGQDDNPMNAEAESERIRMRSDAAADESSPRSEADQEPAAEVDRARPTQLDPRSYPAKSVPQRMVIISAGVIMNLIFAVIFAAIAYRTGVDYTPAISGGTVPGDPAWIENIRPGDQVVQIGKKGEPNRQLRFDKDMMPKIVLNGDTREIPLLIRRASTGKEEWVTMTPRKRDIGGQSRAAIGMSPPQSNRLGPEYSIRAGSPAAAAGFEPHDVVVEISGVPIATENDIQAVLAQRTWETLQFKVERAPKPESSADAPPQVHELTVAPAAMREIGLEMEMGPIVAVRKDSPAAAAGFKTGDVIVSVNAEPAGDPFTLSERLLRRLGESTTIAVKRTVDGAEQTVELQATPAAPLQYALLYNENSPIGLESLGVAIEIKNRIARVRAGGPAEKAGLQAGDLIKTVQIKAPDDDTHQKIVDLIGKDYADPIELGEASKSWPYVAGLIQLLPLSVEYEITHVREASELSSTVSPVASETWHTPDRGLRPQLLEREHQVDSWGEAFALGFRETKERLTEVLIVLSRLVTGELSPKNLGGPLLIATAAGSEASQGVTSLLMFLTFISCNLAILNFLPIPALDGGHMVFLTAEAVLGKPVNERLQITLTLIGIGCLLCLMIFVTVLDIDRLFG